MAGFWATNSIYNLATGLGSVDGKLLVSNWASSSGVTASFGPISILSPGAASANVTFAGSPAVTASSFTVTITATTTMASKAYIGTTKVVVAVTKAPPTITFLANTAKMNPVQGSSATTVVSFMTGGTFSGTVTLQPVAVTDSRRALRPPGQPVPELRSARVWPR